MPILLKTLIKSKKKVTIFPLHEYWADIGHFDELEKVRQLFLSNKKINLFINFYNIHKLYMSKLNI